MGFLRTCSDNLTHVCCTFLTLDHVRCPHRSGDRKHWHWWSCKFNYHAYHCHILRYILTDSLMGDVKGCVYKWDKQMWWWSEKKRIRTAIFKMGNLRGPTLQHRKLCSVSYNNINGKRIWRRIDACMCTTESLCCTPETNIKLLVTWSLGLRCIKRNAEGRVGFSALFAIFQSPF